jgi:hypothetical protein
MMGMFLWNKLTFGCSRGTVWLERNPSFPVPDGRAWLGKGQHTFNGRFRLIISLIVSSSSKDTYSAPAASSSLNFRRLWYTTRIPNASAFFFKLRPIPPIPMIPRIFPSGSWPSTAGGLPRHLPSRSDSTDVFKLRKAPRMRNIFVSAVASSTAVGTLDTRRGGSRELQAFTSIVS